MDIVRVLEFDSADDAVSRANALGIPEDSLEVVRVRDRDTCLCLLTSKDAIQDVEEILEENKRLRLQLERAGDALMALTERARADSAALSEARETARTWKRRYEDEIPVVGARPSTAGNPLLASGGSGFVSPSAGPSPRTPHQYTSSFGLPQTLSSANLSAAIPVIAPGACRVRGCTCTLFVSRSDTTWLCSCNHTSIKHQHLQAAGGAPQSSPVAISGVSPVGTSLSSMSLTSPKQSPKGVQSHTPASSKH